MREKVKLLSKMLCLLMICNINLIINNCYSLTSSEESPNPLDIYFSTYLGGIGEDGTGEVCINSLGEIVFASSTWSPDFPVVNAFQPTKNASSDCHIGKFSSDGQELLYSTFFGGPGLEYIYCTLLDEEDNIIVAGTTSSQSFPLANALKSNRSASDREVFLTKFTPDGQELIFSTFICGTSGWVADIALDSEGNIVLMGCTDVEELLATNNTYQPNKNDLMDSFITKISADGQTCLFSTYLGGSGSEQVRGLVVDTDDNIILTGYTNSNDFPLINSLCNKSTSINDNFIAKLSADGKTLLFSSYFGGTRNWGLNKLIIDENNNIIFFGETNAASFPTVNAYQEDYGGGETDGFFAKIMVEDYSMAFSSYFGGINSDGVHSMVINNDGDFILTGSSNSYNLPTQNPYQTHNGQWDAFISKFDKNGQQLDFATYLGGFGNDYGYGSTYNPTNNTIVLFGHTSSYNFPLVLPYQANNHGGDFDMYLIKFTIIEQSSSKVGSEFSTGFLGGFTIMILIFVTYSLIKNKQNRKTLEFN